MLAIRESPFVRFVNATAFNESVDVYWNETRRLLRMSPGKVTDYEEWLAERHELEVRVPRNAMPLIVDSGSLRPGERYTIVMYSKTAATGIAVFRDCFTSLIST